jgi:hypothetical protein
LIVRVVKSATNTNRSSVRVVCMRLMQEEGEDERTKSLSVLTRGQRQDTILQSANRDNTQRCTLPVTHSNTNTQPHKAAKQQPLTFTIATTHVSNPNPALEVACIFSSVRSSVKYLLTLFTCFSVRSSLGNVFKE